MKYNRKGHKDRNRHKDRLKGVGKLGWFMSKTKTAISPPRQGEPGGLKKTINMYCTQKTSDSFYLCFFLVCVSQPCSNGRVNLAPLKRLRLKMVEELET